MERPTLAFVLAIGTGLVGCAPAELRCGSGTEESVAAAVRSIDQNGDGALGADDVRTGRASFVVEWRDNGGRTTVTVGVEEPGRLVRSPFGEDGVISYLATAPIPDCNHPADLNVRFLASDQDTGVMRVGAVPIEAVVVSVPRLEISAVPDAETGLVLDVATLEDNTFTGLVDGVVEVELASALDPDRPVMSATTVHALVFRYPQPNQ